MEEKKVRRDDEPFIRVSRDLPLPWLLTIVAGLFFHAISVWIGVANVTKATEDNTKAVVSLRETMSQKTVNDAMRDQQLRDHDRRLGALEARVGVP